MKRAALRYAEILEKGAWVTHQEQAEIAKLLRSLVMTEDQAWDELEARLNRQKAIKQPKQEPVCTKIEGNQFETFKVRYEDAVKLKDLPVGTKLYTAPPSKPWVSLTDEEIENFNLPDKPTVKQFVWFVEAKLKDKNNKPEKKWIGLENIDFQYQPPAEVITMKYAEAILKEKNK